MLTSSDVRILYLRLLRREPTTVEIDLAQTEYSTIQQLETNIKASTEYHTVLYPNIPPTLLYRYDPDEQIIKVENVPATYPYGVLMSNGRVGFKTTGKYSKSDYTYVRSEDGYKRAPCYDFTDIRLSKFSNPQQELMVSNHNQTLYLSQCRFTHQFFVDAEKDSEIEEVVPVLVQIDKYPLFNHKSCVLQKYTLRADENAKLILSHQIRSGYKKFKSGKIELNDGNMYNVCEVENQVDSFYVNALTMTHYPDDSITHIGNVNKQSEVERDDFEIFLTANTYSVFYVLTSVTLSDYNNPSTNLNVLNNLIHIPFTQTIDQHILNWRRTLWDTNISIVPKSSASEAEYVEINTFNGLIQRALFSLYTDCFEFDADIDMFVLPTLVTLKPNLAKRVLDIRRRQITSPTNHVHTNVRDSKYKLISEKSISYNITVLALTCIHIWNTFRVTRDKNWLLNNGYPSMLECCEHLQSHSFENVNTVTNYLVKQAIDFTNQALYELNYVLMKDFTLSSNYTVPYFDDTRLINPSSLTIVVRVEESEGLYHYAFYDDEAVGGAFLGYRFGGDSGYKLALADNTEYIFKFEFSLVEYPIQFTLLVPDSGFYISNLDYDTIGQFTQFYIPSPNSTSITLTSARLIGYAHRASIDSEFDVFKGKFNTIYGKYAFITQSLTNIVKPYYDYNFELLNRVEHFVMFNSYYNASFYKGQTSTTINSYKKTFVDMVGDNVVFYNKHTVDRDMLTVLLEAGLEGMVAQNANIYTKRKNHLQLCQTKLIRSLLDTTMSQPWFFGNLSSELLFVVVTCLLELTVKGETNRARAQITEYGLKYTPKSVLPLPWNKLTASNIGIEKQNIVLSNAMFSDSPFNDFPEGMTLVVSIHDTQNNTVTFNIDWSTSFPNGIPETFHYYVVLQSQDDDIDYTDENNKDQLLQLAETESEMDRPDKTIVYTPLIGVVDSVESYDIPELHNRIVHVVYSEDDDFNTAFKRKTFDMSVLPQPTDNNNDGPSLSATLDYDINGQEVYLQVALTYNSLIGYSYQPFTEINVSFEYDDIVFDTNDIFFTEDVLPVIFQNDTKTIQLSLSLDNSVVASEISIGVLNLRMIYSAISNLNSYTSNVYDVLKGNIHITNASVFPPNVSIQPMPSEFVNNPIVFLDYQSVIDGYLHGIPLLKQVGGLGFGDSINSLLANVQIMNIFGGIDNAVFKVKENGSVRYYAIGFNEYNMLMTNTLSDSLHSLKSCVALDQLVSSTGSDIQEVHTTNTFSMVLLENGKVYGIGYNESFNLGDGTMTNRTTFVESSVINDLASGLGAPITRLVLNDKAVLIQFGNNTLYGLGDIDPIFVTESMPVELTEMNVMLSGYAIERIESGDKHFKFVLDHNGTKEWWGIGLNRYNSMGLDSNVNADIEYTGRFHRLHTIERFINGRLYEKGYTGVHSSTPDSAYVVKSHDLPTASVIVLDTITNKIYMIGTFYPQDDTVIPEPDWVEVDMIETVPKFLSMCGRGFVMNQD